MTPPTLKPSNPGLAHAGLGLLLFVTLVFILPSSVLLLILHFGPPVITQTGDVGTFASAASHEGLTNITTSDGTITVRGGFSALAGQHLFVRRSNKFGLQLCAVGQPGNCASVSGTWTGAMKTLPYPKHWYTVDFARHQLDSGTLTAMLMMGIVTALGALLVCGSAYSAEGEPPTSDRSGKHGKALGPRAADTELRRRSPGE